MSTDPRYRRSRVWSEVHKLLADPEHLLALAEEYVERQSSAEVPDDLGDIERQIAELEAKRTTTAVEYMRAGVTPPSSRRRWPRLIGS